jgi:hypothetical protein
VASDRAFVATGRKLLTAMRVGDRGIAGGRDHRSCPWWIYTQSQSATRADSATGQMYQTHKRQGWRILLFVRRRKNDERGFTSPYQFLGPARYVSHESEKPMRIIWELLRPVPPGLFSEVKIAAG